MKILYYTWGESVHSKCVVEMRKLGWQVEVIDVPRKQYDHDGDFMEYVTKKLKEGFDCIFSFDYFPDLSRVAQREGCRYISWVYDSPHLTLSSVTLANPCNAVFLFDRVLYETFRAEGITTVYHLPLAGCGYEKEKSVCTGGQYQHDVTFLGSLYDNEFNFLDQIANMPGQLLGYIEGIVEAQLLIYGFDFASKMFDHVRCEELAKYAKVDMGPLYRECRDEIFRNMIRKKATVLERRRLLSALGLRFDVDLYSWKQPENLEVHYKGYANYNTQMPEIFWSSKVNLNFTLRSILSGIPLRVIDITSCRGFLITNYQEELADYFVNDRDLVWFEDEGDLLEKTDFYLTHEEERNRIAENGYQIVKDEFSYRNRLTQIFRQIR